MPGVNILLETSGQPHISLDLCGLIQVIDKEEVDINSSCQIFFCQDRLGQKPTVGNVCHFPSQPQG